MCKGGAGSMGLAIRKGSKPILFPQPNLEPFLGQKFFNVGFCTNRGTKHWPTVSSNIDLGLTKDFLGKLTVVGLRQ